MDFQSASDILELTPHFSLQELKKNYYKLALKWHPDKNQSSKESTSKFQRIQEAFEYLSNYLKIEAKPSSTDYISIFENFIYTLTGTNYTNIIQILIGSCHDISLKLCKEFSQESLIKLYGYLYQYSDLLGITNEGLINLESIIREKNSNVVILNPTIDNLFNNDIYKLPFDSDIFYIPLWHDELNFDSSLIVKCIADLPKHISLDHLNNIHINLSTNIADIKSKSDLSFNLGEKVFGISTSQLNIKKNQTVILKNKGISLINTDNIFNIDKRSNIYAHIEFKDIMY